MVIPYICQLALGYAIHDICSDTLKCPDAVVLPPSYFNAPFRDELDYYCLLTNTYEWWSALALRWQKLTQGWDYKF